MANAQDTDEFYYDTDDAFNFYMECWGGENVHIGLYPDGFVPTVDGVREASMASLELLLDKVAANLEGKGAAGKAMDMGSCYGGCARRIVARFGSEVLCVELSKKENEVNRARNKAANLEHLVKCPKELSFLDTEAESGAYDCVVSQDSFLHAGKERGGVLKESFRVLKPGGRLVFTDIMQSDSVDPRELAAVYQRIGLEDMGSPSSYVKWGEEAGLKFVGFTDMSPQMITHYGSLHVLLTEWKANDRFKGKVSDAYIEAMLSGLEQWVKHGKAGNLAWGYAEFIKP